MNDDLWFKRQRLQDELDLVLQEFEEKNKIEVKEITFIRLGQVKQIYSRVRIDYKEDL